jgi:hypothetical protein
VHGTNCEPLDIIGLRSGGRPVSSKWYGTQPTYGVTVPSTTAKLLGRGAARIPGLKRLPLVKLVAVGEIALLARRHATLLDSAERRRLLELVRRGRGRTRNLSEDERAELAVLVAKAEPRRFAVLAADALSPVPLPKRLTRA